MTTNLFIIGASEPGYEILDILERLNDPEMSYRFLGFFDEMKKGQGIFDAVDAIPVDARFVSSIGDVFHRQRLFTSLRQNGFVAETIVAPGSWVSTHALLGRGVVVYPNCSISHGAEIGDNVLINYNCSISHGSRVGDHTNICPGVNIAGDVTVGSSVFLGLGTKIREQVRVCDNVYLGANSTVVSDIERPGVYVGTPCRFLRELKVEPHGESSARTGVASH